MALPFRMPNLGPRARLALRIAGYIALALFTFVFALQLTFPFDRVKSRIEDELSSKYEVTIGSIDRGWVPGRVYLHSITLRTRAAKPDEVATIFIKELEINLGLFALIGGTASVDLDATLGGGGSLSGNVSVSKGATRIALEGTNVQAGMLPLHELVGLPASGTLQLAIELELPNETPKNGKRGPNWQKAKGHIELGCPSGCSVGDGKAKLKTKLKNQRNQAMVGDGMEFGKVNIKSLLAVVEIGAGKLEITKFDTQSDDGTLQIDYAMDLQPAFSDSDVTGCLRFTGSQALLKREEKTFNTFTLIGGALGPDNLYHVRLTGKYKDLRKLGQVCGADAPDHGGNGGSGNGGSGNGGSGKRRTQPNLTVQPPDQAGSGSDGMRPVPNFVPPATLAPGSNPDAGTHAPSPPPELPIGRVPVPATDGSGSHTGSGSGSAPPPGIPEAGSGSAGSGDAPAIQ